MAWFLERIQGQRRAIAPAALMLAAAGLGVYLRLAGMARYPLWLDEAYSAYAAAHGWYFLWQVVPRYETHPPFYYSLLHLWTLAFGDGLTALRALGVAASLAMLPVIALAARELARTRADGDPAPTMLAALLLAALAPFPIAMAHQVRPYPVLMLVYAAACLALLRIGREIEASAGLRLPPLAGYLATLALVLWLHNLGPLYAAAMVLALAVLVLGRGLTRRDWLLLVVGHLAVGLVYLPAFLMLIDQAPTWVHSTWLHFTTHNLKWRLASIYAVSTLYGAWAAVALAIMGIVALGTSGSGGRRAAAALILLGGLPVALSVAISLYASPVFIERTMAAVAVPGLLLMAAPAGRGWLRWPAWAALALLAQQMGAVDRQRLRHVPWDDWYGAVRWTHARFRPGDMIFAYPNEGALPFDYAARDLGLGMPDRPIPTVVPAFDSGGWYPTGSRGVVSLPRGRLRAIAEAPATRAVPTIWLLRVGANAYDKGDVFLDELGRDRVTVDEYDEGPIDIIGLRRGDIYRREAPAVSAAPAPPRPR